MPDPDTQKNPCWHRCELGQGEWECVVEAHGPCGTDCPEYMRPDCWDCGCKAQEREGTRCLAGGSGGKDGPDFDVCYLTPRKRDIIRQFVEKEISLEVLEVVEAVIGEEYNCEHCEHFALDNNPFGDPCFDEWICKRDYELKNEHWVCGDWTRRKPTPVTKPLPPFEDMKGIYADKPCPTCGGSGSVPCRPDEHGGVNDLRECPTCTGKHFVPGKGRGM